jgi:hypothetical protein
LNWIQTEMLASGKKLWKQKDLMKKRCLVDNCQQPNATPDWFQENLGPGNLDKLKVLQRKPVSCLPGLGAF